MGLKNETTKVKDSAREIFESFRPILKDLQFSFVIK